MIAEPSDLSGITAPGTASRSRVSLGSGNKSLGMGRETPKTFSDRLFRLARHGLFGVSSLAP